ncbi:MAG: hypothetical protein EOO81_02700 [Oxalobacteraceae bacterium]|nr:MAG: hypothetical protein EOO81_02700 [Oxalobacteraceae bacterium]
MTDASDLDFLKIQPEALPERSPIFLVITALSLITATLFSVSLIANSVIFGSIGISFTQIATPGDVVMSGFLLFYRSVAGITFGLIIMFVSWGYWPRMAALFGAMATDLIRILLTTPLPVYIQVNHTSAYVSLGVVLSVMGFAVFWSRRITKLNEVEVHERAAIFERWVEKHYPAVLEKLEAGGYDFYNYGYREPVKPERLPDGFATAVAGFIEFTRRKGRYSRWDNFRPVLFMERGIKIPEPARFADGVPIAFWPCIVIAAVGALSTAFHPRLGYAGEPYSVMHTTACPKNVLFWSGEHSVATICVREKKTFPMILMSSEDLKIVPLSEYQEEMRAASAEISTEYAIAFQAGQHAEGNRASTRLKEAFEAGQRSQAQVDATGFQKSFDAGRRFQARGGRTEASPRPPTN